MGITPKSPAEIASMRVAGRLTAEALDFVAAYVAPGVSTGTLDRLLHDYIVHTQHAIPAALGYAPPGYAPYPGSVCISVNDQVCHGIPSEHTILRTGDILNIDVALIRDGYHGDASRMYLVGEVAASARRLSEAAHEAMWCGIAAVHPGARLGDIGEAVERHATARGYAVVREFCGHGIGRVFHEETLILNYGQAGAGPTLEAGMSFTVEPMLTAGAPAIFELADGWTCVTRDRSLSAQWEHTVLVTSSGVEVLTQSAGTPPCPPHLHLSI